jgi:predicted small metal-binding protein
METVLHCDCGFEVHADDEAELVARVQRHALDAHGMQFTAEEVLQLASRAELKRPGTSRPQEGRAEARPNRVLPAKEEK